MRMFRLAQLLEQKYSDLVVKSAQSGYAHVFAQVKKDILNNYKHWVMGKYRALKMFAESGEPYSKDIYSTYNDLVANIDTYSPVKLFNRLNKILGTIKEMKLDPQKYRDSIHNSVDIFRESDKNYREYLKSGFETNLKNISFGLEKAAKTLRGFIPEAELAGGAVEPQRKALSKEKLLTFMRTPAAQTYGLDNIDVMTRLLEFPELREKITTLINAVDRGHFPIDGPEVFNEASNIKKFFDAMQTTNEPYFEAGEDRAQRAQKAELLTDPEQWSRQMLQRKREKQQEKQQEEIAEQEKLRLEPVIKQRDEEHKQREIEEDRKRHVRSEGSALLQEIIKKRYQL